MATGNAVALPEILRLDLPKLPSDWRWVQFSDICVRVSVGHVGPTAEYFRDRADSVPFLRSQNVRPGRLVLETATAIAPEFHQKLKKSKLQPGDILFVRVGANRGDCCVVPEGVGELNCANIVFARPKHRTGFHAYFFQGEFGRSLLLSASVGAAQGVINTSSVASMPVPLPPVPVQRRIAGVLSAYDDLIENNQRRIRILEEMARALYREWFVHFRFPGHEKLRRVASSFGDIPAGWEVKRLEEVCRSVQDGDWIETKDQGGDAYRLVQISNIGIGEFIETGNLRFITQQTYDRLRCNEILPNDILVARMPTPIGRAWTATAMPWRMITAVDVAIVRTQPELIHPLFLSVAWNELTNLQRIAAQASGTTRARVTRRELVALEFVIPPSKLQLRFAKFVEPQMEMIQALRLQTQNLRRTRDLLLPRLISGQISLSDASPPEAGGVTHVLTNA